jgi:hypothetical protein
VSGSRVRSRRRATGLDWGKRGEEGSRKKWGLGRPVSNGRRAFPHLEMGCWRLIHTNGPGGPDGLGTVTFRHVAVPTRRLHPTVTGDGVRFESRDILHK